MKGRNSSTNLPMHLIMVTSSNLNDGTSLASECLKDSPGSFSSSSFFFQKNGRIAVKDMDCFDVELFLARTTFYVFLLLIERRADFPVVTVVVGDFLKVSIALESFALPCEIDSPLQGTVEVG